MFDPRLYSIANPIFNNISTGAKYESNANSSTTKHNATAMITALIDEVNNKPVVRKGITATDIRLDYNGRKEFLIDAACFHGSSGSPVFLRKMGPIKRRYW